MPSEDAQHLETRINDLQAQIDRRIETQERERNDDRKHYDAIFEEREKAIAALEVATERLVREGDASLERHIEAQFESVKAALAAVERLGEEKDKRLESVQEAAQRAIQKAEEAMTARLDLLNEFRSQSIDEQRKFATREVLQKLEEQYEKRLNSLEHWKSTVGGRTAVYGGIGAVLIAVLSALVTHAFI